MKFTMVALALAVSVLFGVIADFSDEIGAYSKDNMGNNGVIYRLRQELPETRNPTPVL
jgi:hypothetical protein